MGSGPGIAMLLPRPRPMDAAGPGIAMGDELTGINPKTGELLPATASAPAAGGTAAGGTAATGGMPDSANPRGI